METKQGTIQSLTQTNGVSEKTGKSWLRFAFIIDGNTYSTFDDKIGSAFHVGDVVEMTGEQAGQYWNMKTMKLLDEAPEVVKVGKAENLNKDKVIIRESALKSAVEFWKIFKTRVEVDTLLETAEKFEQWILR